MNARKSLMRAACLFGVLLLLPCHFSFPDINYEVINENGAIENEGDNRQKDVVAQILELKLRLKILGKQQSPSAESKTSVRRGGKEDIRNCTTAKCVAKYLEYHNKTATAHAHQYGLRYWMQKVNITEANDNAATASSLAQTKWYLKELLYIRKLLKRNIPGLSEQQKRLLLMNSVTANSFQPAIRRLLNQVMSSMSSIYGLATVNVGGKNLTQGEAGPIEFLRKSRNCQELASVWKQWRDISGKKMKCQFTEMVKLLNIGARENGFSDYGFYEWSTDFEVPNFNELVMNLYSKISPLYKELHAYARYKLKSAYPDCVDANDPIPAHLLGNVWAQDFQNIFDLLKPYPSAVSPDVTKSLVQQGWTVNRMFKAAEEFFVSIGLFNMTDKFWQRSMFTKPKGRAVDCHGSAHDIFEWNDFRIKMCTTLTQDAFKTVHHEMGHIIYDMSYQHQPYMFREGPNSGFHEAIGDTIALAATTPTHLKKLKLVNSLDDSEEADINALMHMALDKVVFLPFALLIDTWRWRVFNGTITPDHYNKEWWKLRHDLQGLKPPVKRTDDDFDSAAKYHVAENVGYIRYFTSTIMQFQFYEAMCKASGHTGPLYKCDFYQSKDAGALLKSMLALGRSKPWPEAMKVMTGQSNILLDSLVRYFEPLQDWLRKYRKENGYPIGWPKKFKWQ